MVCGHFQPQLFNRVKSCDLPALIDQLWQKWPKTLTICSPQMTKNWPFLDESDRGRLNQCDKIVYRRANISFCGLSRKPREDSGGYSVRIILSVKKYQISLFYLLLPSSLITSRSDNTSHKILPRPKSNKQNRHPIFELIFKE
jgi:hypothetical protein